MAELWYEKPALEWEEALPVGNGRLGAMVYGGVDREILQVNEESMWFGGAVNRNNPDSRKNLPVIRELLDKGEISRAEKLMDEALSGCPEGMHAYQTLGEVQLFFDNLLVPGVKKSGKVGKTTLTQALRGEKIHYHKTQYVNNFDVIVDTPGEYAQTKGLGHALALYTYESDVVGLLVSATEPYCLFPPCITCMANREVIGIVTKIHNPDANVKLATSWLELAGCKKIFYVDSRQQEGIPEILEYLREDGDVMPWEKDASDPVN